MERLTAEAIARLLEERTSAIEQWRRKRERHEEFAVWGSTNNFHHNEEISQIVLSCLRKLPLTIQEEGCREYEVTVRADGFLGTDRCLKMRREK